MNAMEAPSTLDGRKKAAAGRSLDLRPSQRRAIADKLRIRMPKLGVKVELRHDGIPPGYTCLALHRARLRVARAHVEVASHDFGRVPVLDLARFAPRTQCEHSDVKETRRTPRKMAVSRSQHITEPPVIEPLLLFDPI